MSNPQRGRCPVCGLHYVVRSNTGLLIKHFRFAGWGEKRPKCKGSGKPPLPDWPRVRRPRKKLPATMTEPVQFDITPDGRGRTVRWQSIDEQGEGW